MELFICKSCRKNYSSKQNLKNHYIRQPLCVKWMELSKDITSVIDKKFIEEEVDGCEEEKHECGACGREYSNLGNLNKHIAGSIICKKWLKYMEFEPMINSMRNYICLQ